MNRRALAISAVTLLASITMWAADSTDEYVQTFLKTHKVPGAAIAVIRDGKVLKEFVYGEASLQLSVPVQQDTIFQLASVTKIFTTMTLLKLEQAGKLNLDDKVALYIPDLPQAWQATTLRHLATHTSGLPDIIASPDRPLSDVELGRSAEDALKYAESMPAVSSPGTQFKYDQTNYLLLLRVIEHVCGASFEDCVRAQILNPAGMKDTVWGDARQIVPRRSEMYTALHGDRIENGANLFTYPQYLDAAAGMNSDIVDMEKLGIALTSGSVLSAAEAERMWEPANTPNGKVLDISKEMEITGVVAPAAGWFFADNSGGKYPRVFMAGGSAVSILVLPKQHICVVVLTNLQDKDDPLPIAEGLVKHYLSDFTPML